MADSSEENPFYKAQRPIIIMKKFIEVNGKMMDAVEFTRFIRTQMADETQKHIQEVVKRSKRNKERLRQLQKLS